MVFNEYKTLRFTIIRQMLKAIFISAFTIGLMGCAQNFELITTSEYAEISHLPDVDETPRAPPPPDAPKITVHRPDESTVRTPFDIDIRFQTFGDAAIIPATVRVIYLKGVFRKDLTELIRQHARMDENGIYGKRAAIPSGKHRFLVEVSDDRGRLGEARFEVRVID